MNTPCLDRGFVRMLAHMGTDATICAAARISYGADPATATEDERLIRYLMRNRHTSPFEMAEVQVHVKAPIFVAEQWFRHRTASINRISARYKVLPDEVYIPDQIHGAPTSSKQGRGAVHPDSERWRRGMEAEAASALRRYREMISAGVAPEQARIVLPVGVYTEWVWKIDLHNLLHFLSLRLHPHAQYEIRVYASALAQMVAEMFPLSWQAFLDYRLNAVTLSAPEIRALRAVLEGVPPVPGHGRGEAAEWAELWGGE